MRTTIAAVLMALGICSPVQCGYDKNITGKITELLTYPSGALLIRIDSQPTQHTACNPIYFAVEGTQSAAVSRMLARAMLAYATQAPINIGYDSVGDCSFGYIRIHRVG